MKHGVYVREQKTSVSTPVVAESGVPFVIGTAPVHSAESPAALYTPVLCTDWDEAVKKLGYSDDWKTYTICEVMYSHFKLFQCQPIIFCNVLDLTTHKEAVAGAEITLSGKQAKLPFDAILSSLVVKAEASSESPLVKDADYAAYYSDGSLIIETIDDGAASDAVKLYVSYDKVKTSGVGDNDIVKGIDAIDICMATVSTTPDLIIAPGWSHTDTVQTVMAAKAEVINGILGAKCICDIDCSADGARSYDAAVAKKSATNLIDPAQIAVWPQVKLGGRQFHLSTQLAGLMAQVDSGNDGVPYESPSNKNLQCDGACLEDGTDVILTLEKANILNASGICTALRFMNGWVAWGDHTACYPGNTDIKDYFIPVSRMFKWVGNSLIKTFWSKVDSPMNRRLLDNIKDSADKWLSGLVGSEYLLGARVEILDSENPMTDLMAGIVRIHIYMTPSSPAQEIDFILEYDADYVQSALA